MLYLFSACGSGNAPVVNVEAVKDSTIHVASPAPVKQIVFFGNSITAGYGLQPSEAFTSIIQLRLDSLQLPYRAVNAGVSGETSSGG